jgi:hypothetical protein
MKRRDGMARKKSQISSHTKEQILQIYEYEKEKAKREMIAKQEAMWNWPPEAKTEWVVGPKMYEALIEAKKEGSSPLDINDLATAEDNSVSPDEKQAQRKKWMEWMIEQPEFKDDLKADMMRQILDKMGLDADKYIPPIKTSKEVFIPIEAIRKEIYGNR